MNNEKLILEVLGFLMDTRFLSSEESKEYLILRGKINNVLNPKQDLPYAESLFVKSSINEKEVGK